MGNENEEVKEDVREVAPEILEEARSQGWVEVEKYRGNKEDWIDADTFVKRGREILPIIRKNNENLVRDLYKAKEELKEYRESMEEFKAFQKEAYARKVSDYEQRLSELKESRAQAITDGDGQKVNALDDAIDETKDDIREAKEATKEVVKAKVEDQQSTIDPAVQTWLDDNKWFGKDVKLTAVANGVGESLKMNYPNLSGTAFLEKLDEELEELMPGKFGKSKSQQGSPVESGSGRGGRRPSDKHSYDNLPAEAKAACDRYVKQKLLTREDYVADYDWSE